MTITIETINGKKCTVIRKPFDAEWVKGRLAMNIPVMLEDSGCVVSASSVLLAEALFVRDNAATFIYVSLPALPRKPKPEEVYAYLKEGIDPVFDGNIAASSCVAGTWKDLVGVHHALYNNERVEIALED